MIETVLGVIQTLFSASARAKKKRERIAEATRLVGVELDNLANLFSLVLEATDPDGKIKSEKISELHALQIRNWSRWQSILESGAFNLIPDEDRKDIESLINIASAAPGDYIEEILLVQNALRDGQISTEVRNQLSGSISRIRDKATKLKLTV